MFTRINAPKKALINALKAKEKFEIIQELVKILQTVFHNSFLEGNVVPL